MHPWTTGLRRTSRVQLSSVCCVSTNNNGMPTSEGTTVVAAWLDGGESTVSGVRGLDSGGAHEVAAATIARHTGSDLDSRTDIDQGRPQALMFVLASDIELLGMPMFPRFRNTVNLDREWQVAGGISLGRVPLVRARLRSRHLPHRPLDCESCEHEPLARGSRPRERARTEPSRHTRPS